MAYGTSDIRKGLKITIDGQPYTVVEFQFVKPGKGAAFTRTKIKNLITGAVLERSYRTGEKFEEADVEEKTMQFSYADGDTYYFMDTETYDQVPIHEDQIGGTKDYLIDNLECDVIMYGGRPIGITPPNFVVIEIAETEPGVKGDTASNVTKPAKLTTGATIHVPLFVNAGEKIRIDTRTAEYVERAR